MALKKLQRRNNYRPKEMEAEPFRGTTKSNSQRRRLLIAASGLPAYFLLDLQSGASASQHREVTTKESRITNTSKPLFSKVVQVAMVVKDIQASVKRYWDDLGVGPWRIYTCDASNTSNLTVYGRPVEYAFKAALANIGEMEWELIEPLDDRSVYAEYLAKHGEGLHHIAFDVDDFDLVSQRLESKGYANIQSGRLWDIQTYSYFSLDKGLACVAELVSAQTGAIPQPESTYP